MEKNMENELEIGFIQTLSDDYHYILWSRMHCIIWSRVPPTDLVGNHVVHSVERSSKSLVCYFMAVAIMAVAIVRWALHDN